MRCDARWARCLTKNAKGQGLQDSPLRPLSRVLQNLQVMDEVRCQVGAVFNEER